MTKREREVADLIKRHGCKVIERREGKHWVYRLATEAGKVFCLTVFRTPSDRRDLLNMARDIRRAMTTN